MFLPTYIIVCMGPPSLGKLKLFFVLHYAWSENYCFYFLVFTFQRKRNEEKKRDTASARSNNCSCTKKVSWKKDILTIKYDYRANISNKPSSFLNAK